jgi:hypothetical protein
LGGGVVLANGWVDTKIAESVHELRERSSFSAKIELATRAISQSIAELECASAGSKGKGQRRADLSPAWGAHSRPPSAAPRTFKLVPQEMPQSKM